MAIYFCFDSYAFYDTFLHGERTLSIPDPSWQGDSASRPMVSVPNPRCMVPAKAVEVTQDQFIRLSGARDMGMRLVPGPDGKPVAVPGQPDLDAIRERIRGALNAERARRERAGFPYLGKWVDADPDSVDRMTAAVLAAMAAQTLGQPFATSWTCADNSELPLDAAGMIGMPVAFASYGQALHDYCKARKAELPNLDLAQLQNYDAMAGWPEG